MEKLTTETKYIIFFAFVVITLVLLLTFLIAAKDDFNEMTINVTEIDEQPIIETDETISNETLTESLSMCDNLTIDMPVEVYGCYGELMN